MCINYYAGICWHISREGLFCLPHECMAVLMLLHLLICSWLRLLCIRFVSYLVVPCPALPVNQSVIDLLKIHQC